MVIKKLKSKVSRPKKSKPVEQPVESAAPVEETRDNAPELKVVAGELFWEYRAKLAEWEKAYVHVDRVKEKLDKEKKNPVYKPLLDLLSKEDEVRREIKAAGDRLMDVQRRLASSLGIKFEDFLKEYVIDHETGVVRRTF